jgi:hypothetical protein
MFGHRWFFSLILFITSCNNPPGPPDTSHTEDGNSIANDAQVNNAALRQVPMPELDKQPVRLRVAYAENARMAPLPVRMLEKILKRAEQLVLQNFNVKIKLEHSVTLPIQSLFSTLDENVIASRKDEIVDIDDVNNAIREDMQLAVYNTLQNYTDEKENVIAYAQPYLSRPDIKQDNFISLSYALVDTLLERLEYWEKQKAPDGKPIIGDDPYHQWVWWDSLGYSALPYDIVITNQLVASAENYGMDVHSCLRGGITAGTTTYNKHSDIGTYVYIMLYPMLNDSDLLTRLRQDSHYSDQQVVNYSAALLTHELGHMLLHLGHPFARKYCIMSPTTMLDYRDWYDNLDPARCRVNSSKEMQPGAAKIMYNPGW